jgi:photosystem II stability/assembly factor-like uncharacterized protein
MNPSKVKSILALSAMAMAAAMAASAQSPGVDPALFADLQYRNIGPTRGGRVTAVAGVASQPSTFYMGSVGGGVWKTTDFGQSWRNITDGYLETGSIGALRVAPSDPNVIYVGTGSEAIRSNVIVGRGVYKSMDAGRTWTFIGLRDMGQIGAVEIHPTDPNIAYVAAVGHAFGPNLERGLFRTRDGGATWDKALFLSDEVGVVDVELAPDDPNTLYASAWRAERKPWTIISGAEDQPGVWKSTDAGENWRELRGGLPEGLKGKSDLAVSAADPNRLYGALEE